MSRKVVEFGGDEAGKLYNGTTIIAGGPTGAFRLPGFEPGEFSEMCNREYQENGNPDGPFSATDEATNTKYGALVGMCSTIRMIARALDAAGPNPTRADLADAMEGLGAIDQGADSNFGSLRPGQVHGTELRCGPTCSTIRVRTRRRSSRRRASWWRAMLGRCRPIPATD